MKEKRFRMKKRYYVFMAIVMLTVILNLVAVNSNRFCDWYIDHIFPIWLNTYGRLTGLFPFSVGEWMIVVGIVLVLLVLLFAVYLLVYAIVKMVRRLLHKQQISKSKFVFFITGYYKVFAWILASVALVMTLNCFVLYRASTFSQRHFQTSNTEYTTEELLTLYNDIAAKSNALAKQVKRDDKGVVYYPVEGISGVPSKDQQLDALAKQATIQMQRLGETYSRLSGWYPKPKRLLSSDFMCQQYMAGYYFPFSLEANYNDVMEMLNVPSTMCHELSHLRGYIFEDEANFVSFLACIDAEDIYFQYAACLSVLAYINNDVYKLWKNNRELFDVTVEKTGYVQVDSIVWQDDVFVSEEEWERINGKAVIDTEIVDKASDIFIDTNLKLNGVSDGRISYSRVVQLLLLYYRQTM